MRTNIETVSAKTKKALNLNLRGTHQRNTLPLFSFLFDYSTFCRVCKSFLDKAYFLCVRETFWLCRGIPRFHLLYQEEKKSRWRVEIAKRRASEVECTPAEIRTDSVKYRANTDRIFSNTANDEAESTYFEFSIIYRRVVFHSPFNNFWMQTYRSISLRQGYDEKIRFVSPVVEVDDFQDTRKFSLRRVRGYHSRVMTRLSK